MDRQTDGGPTGPHVNPGFALGQLLKAEATEGAHPDAATRGRAGKRARAWRQALAGLMDGTLRVGSRAPVKDVPPWVTTEVLHGGFVSGNLAAAGPTRSPASLLGPEGFAELAAMLDAGCFRVDVPEAAALPTAAWLVRAGDRPAAAALLAEIAPFMARLRFYPVPTDRPFEVGRALCLQPVGEAIRRLEAIRPGDRVMRQRHVVQGWLPLYDRLVRCFEGTVPGEDGALPAGWADEARAILAAHARLAETQPVGTRFRRPGGNFARLLAALGEALAGRWTEGRARQVRHILADIDRSRGLPGSARCQDLRARQAAVVARPDRHELARVLAHRLGGRDRGDGLDGLDGLLDPVTAEEARRFDVLAGAAPYPSLAAIVRRSEQGSLEELVARGQVPSGEVLARLIPAVSAASLVEPLEDPALQRLYAATYLAFRRRRSVLLLNYEKQVQFEELPWVRALAPHVAGASGARGAREAMRKVCWTALTAFPETILPNPLVRELGALAKAAGQEVPLVEELAADIFMGGFTPKFERAAQQAAQALAGTVYARYYDMPAERLAAIAAARGADGRAAGAFSALCAERAGPPQGTASWVAVNGAIIEQAQILTTHNMAPLVAALDLAEPLAGVAADLARRCFDHTIRLLRPARLPWRRRLQALKNAAYAWRQMVYFLSLLPEGELPAFAAWMRERLAKEAPAFQARFRPAVLGLEAAIVYAPAPAEAATPFLGWSTGKHWFLDGGATPGA